LKLDCLVIGHNELPIGQYKSLLDVYGTQSEAFRDLKCSFVEMDGVATDYVGLMNQALGMARGRPLTAQERLKSGDIPSLAAVYLAQFLTRRGFRASYVNLFQESRDEIAEHLRHQPLAVAITTTLYVLNFPVIEIVRYVRSLDPNVRIIVGGPLIANHARNDKRAGDELIAIGTTERSAYASEELTAALSDMGADFYVIEGQGELTLASLLGVLRDGGSIDSVPNLAYLDRTGRLKVTPRVDEGNSLDAEAVDWGQLSDIGATIQTRTARSCAFKCAFCNYPTRAGSLSLASLSTIEQELNAISQRQTVQSVVFIDDTFNVPISRFKEICRMMIRNRYDFRWYSYFRCSNADAEAFDLLAASGCAGVFLGVESGSPTILTNMNKVATPDKYRKGIAELRSRDILTFGSFIIGFPGETDETVAETTEFIQETGLDYYRAQLWYCEAGTPIERQRDAWSIKGNGFKWSHRTMDSVAAMDHIERLLLSTIEPQWLPGWSFDFWIIPYLIGRGLTREQFHRFVALADVILRNETRRATDDASYARSLQRRQLRLLADEAKGWRLHGINLRGAA
jgi:p-methyltransferase